jgi:putative nucleotidyltransferase with HDIG domain
MSAIDRDSAFELMCQYTLNEGLRRHMMTVEIAMRAYAEKFGEDVEKWGVVGLLHDFDYERWPTPPDHPLEGSRILADHGYPEDMIYAIKSHVDQVEGCPRVSLLDKTLFACDELSGFITAVALVRPDAMEGMKAKSVRKKMKQKSFAEKVSREDIVAGAEDLGIDLNTHIQFVIDSITPHAEELDLAPKNTPAEQ